jgi:hypothetical protein
MPQAPKTRRRWFQFGLGTMIVVMTVLAIPLGWLGWQIKYIRDRRDFRARSLWSGMGDWTGTPSPEMPLYRRWLGDERATRVFVNSEEDRQIGERLFPEAWVMYVSADFKLTRESIPDARRKR